MERIKTKDILILVLIAVICGMALKPDNSLNKDVIKRYEDSIERQDSIIRLINNLNTQRNEIKDKINSVDSSYVDLNKDDVRARIRHLMPSR